MQDYIHGDGPHLGGVFGVGVVDQAAVYENVLVEKRVCWIRRTEVFRCGL